MRRLLMLALIPLALLVSAPALAKHGHDRQDDRDQPSYRSHHDRDQERQHARPSRDERGSGISASQAAEQARQHAGGGRVLSVQQHSGGYQVKLLQRDGTVRVIHVDGN